MKVVNGSDHRQYIAPCPGLSQSITGAEVKSTPGQSVSQAPLQPPIYIDSHTHTHTHTHTQTHLCCLSGHESGALWGQHTLPHTAPAGPCSYQLSTPRVPCRLFRVCERVCVCVCVCVHKESRVAAKFQTSAGQREIK